MIPGGTRFIGISESVNLTERKSTGINAETQPYTIEDITSTVKPYKVYTALLTQSGGDGNDSVVGDQTINVGVTYIIDYLAPGDNLIPYGAPNNDQNTSFICNQNVSNWGSGTSQLSFNTGAPVATVLENTIGNVWFTYNSDGNYGVNSNGLFIFGNTALFIGNVVVSTISQNVIFSTPALDSFAIILSSGNLIDQSLINGVLSSTPIEIRVYS